MRSLGRRWGTKTTETPSIEPIESVDSDELPIYYVYGYFKDGDATKECYYIGKGKDNRWKSHVKTKGYSEDDCVILAEKLIQSTAYAIESTYMDMYNPRDNIANGHYTKNITKRKASSVAPKTRASKKQKDTSLPLHNSHVLEYERSKSVIPLHDSHVVEYQRSKLPKTREDTIAYEEGDVISDHAYRELQVSKVFRSFDNCLDHLSKLKSPTLIVYNMSSLGNSFYSAFGRIKKLRDMNVTVEIKNPSMKVGDDIASIAFFNAINLWHEFESENRRERMMGGIERAKKEGKYKGRIPSIDTEAIKELINQGMSISKTAIAAGVSESSVQRVKREMKKAS